MNLQAGMSWGGLTSVMFRAVGVLHGGWKRQGMVAFLPLLRKSKESDLDKVRQGKYTD